MNSPRSVLPSGVMRGRQEYAALVAALALHAAVLGFLRLTEDDRVSGSPQRVPPSPEVSWEVELGEAAADEPSLGQASLAPRDSLNGSDRVASRAFRRPDVAEAPVASVETEMDVATDASPELEDEAREPLPSKPIDLGIGPDGWQRFVTRPKEGEARAERTAPRKNRFQLFRAPPVSTTGGVQEGLEARDRELGLAPSGRVISAVHAAAHTTAAPEVGVARFDVTVHRTGTVEVTLGAASGQVEQWKKVAAHIAKELRAAQPRIPPRRQGLKLVVELSLESTLPNGTNVKSLAKPHVDAPPPKIQSSEAAKEQIAQENPTVKNPTAEDIVVKLDMPGVYLAESGKVCSYRFGLGSISPGRGLGAAVGPTGQGSCDPTNIGAKPQRTVRARVVEEAMF